MAKCMTALLCMVLLQMAYGQMRMADMKAMMEKGCHNAADMVFVLDDSGSIWGPHFKLQKEFVQHIIAEFQPNVTHFGAMTFSDESKIYFYPGEFEDESQIVSAIEQIKQRRGGTKTFDALREMRQKVLAGEHVRPGIPHVCILITDGESEDTEATIEEARRAKTDDGIIIFAIGVGHSINEEELRAVASGPDYYMEVENYNKLDGQLRAMLAYKTCIVTTVPPPTTTTTTTTTTTLPPTTLPQMMNDCTERYPMDVLFSLSDIAGAQDTAIFIDFIDDLLEDMHLSPVQVQVGLTPRFCDPADAIHLRENDSRQGFRTSLEDRLLTTTRTDRHINFMYNEGIAPENGGRLDAASFGVLVIDSPSENLDKTILEASLAREENMQLIVIGVGDRVDPEELSQIAGNEDNVFHVDSYSKLLTRIDDIIDALCKGLRKHH